ncbi:hypothetical protein Tco_0517249 [Tanacetum coccineum]
MPCSCDRRGMWDRRVSIGQTLNENSSLSTLEPLMELIIEDCTRKCNHNIESESEDLSDIDIETLTLEQYLALNRLTVIEALESIQEKVNHLHRWHKEESDKKTSNNSFSTITEKLKILNHDMNNLREGIHKINRKPNMKSRHEEVKNMEDDVDISALTMEQYIDLIPDDIKPGIVNPKIGDDIEFEINANFMRELRRKIFACTYDEDAYEHVCTVLEIVDLFHFPGVTHDAIMLRVFPITLKGRALRWKNRLLSGIITTWDILKKEFIWRC